MTFSLTNWNFQMKIDFYDEESGLDIDKTIANPDEYHRLMWDIIQVCAARIESDDMLNSVLEKKVNEYYRELEEMEDLLAKSDKQNLKMENAILESLHHPAAFGKDRDTICNCPTCRSLRAALERDEDEEDTLLSPGIPTFI